MRASAACASAGSATARPARRHRVLALLLRIVEEALHDGEVVGQSPPPPPASLRRPAAPRRLRCGGQRHQALGRRLPPFLASVGQVVPQRRHAGIGDIDIAAAIQPPVEPRPGGARLGIADDDEVAQRAVAVARHVLVGLGVEAGIEPAVRQPPGGQTGGEEMPQHAARRRRLAEFAGVPGRIEIRRRPRPVVLQQVEQCGHVGRIAQAARVLVDDEAQIDQRMRRAQRRDAGLDEVQQRVLPLLEQVRIGGEVVFAVEIDRQRRPRQRAQRAGSARWC